MFLLLGLILLTTKFVDAGDYEESLSKINLTPGNIALVNAYVEQGTMDNLVDGDYDDFFQMTKGGDPAAMKINFNMDQINCVNRIEMYFSRMEKRTVSLSFTCTSAGCTCGGVMAEGNCKDFQSFSVASRTGELPGNLPEKADCLYGDVASLTTSSPTTTLAFWEISLTGYQPQAKSDDSEDDTDDSGDDTDDSGDDTDDSGDDTDDSEDDEKTKYGPSHATSVAVAGVFPIVAVLRFI